MAGGKVRCRDFQKQMDAIGVFDYPETETKELPHKNLKIPLVHPHSLTE